jgi:peptidoglycan/xylan/chitin deacetylase (PgdA/CDA1 family)
MDVEEDLNKKTFHGVENLDNILKIFDKLGISATLFATGEVLEKYPDLIVKWSKKHEIASHGYYHIPLYELSFSERKKQLGDFCRLYKNILEEKPKGFRAVQHTINNTQLELLEEFGFEYDSSIVPRYIPIRKYVGYKGKAPTAPYHPSYKDYKKKGNMKILEIPVTPLIFGISLYGTWIRVFGPNFYKFLLFSKKPKFINLAMHPWDAIEYEGTYSRNSGEKFQEYLRNILKCVQNYYTTLNGYEIARLQNEDTNYK